MGDIMDEINELLGESLNESEESTPTSEREETGGTNSSEGSKPQTKETEVETEEQQEKDSTEESGDDETSEVEETESEGETKSEDEEDPRDAKIAELQAEINRLAGEQEKPSESEKSSESETSESKDLDPLGDYEFDDIVESKETFTKWAQDYGNKIRQQVIEESTKGVNEIVQQQVTAHLAVDKFYRENSDLEKHRDYVSRVAKDVAKENPKYTYNQVFDEAAKKAREKLGLPNLTEGGDEKSAKQQPKPAFADSGKKASPKKKAAKAEDNLTETEKQIQELLED